MWRENAKRSLVSISISLLGSGESACRWKSWLCQFIPKNCVLIRECLEISAVSPSLESMDKLSPILQIPNALYSFIQQGYESVAGYGLFYPAVLLGFSFV